MSPLDSTSPMKPYALRVAYEAAWAPVTVIALHVVLAKIFGHEPYVDPCVHFLGGAAMAFFVRRCAALGPQFVGSPSPLGLDLMAFGLACFAAVFWELGELGSDLVLGTNIQKDAHNTLRDLALGVAGAVAFLATRRVFARDSRKSP